jgi:predicted enzyme related to lactoylglutathione lyase
MPERDGYIPGVPCWVDSQHPDPKEAAGFYGELFRWELEDVMPPDAGASYYIGRIRGGDVGAVGPHPEGAPPGARWSTYVWVDSADDAVAAARAAGGEAMDAFDVMDAGRMAILTDPEGASICVWQAGRHRGSKVVNEHGSVNFNNLATRDLARAEAFYGAVFGWRTLDLPSGVTWTLPAYGDHLEESTPGLRDQMAQMGAPDGFIDVVAAVEPIADDDATTPAHWSVTFAVDDVQATAAKAKELGGKVVTAPRDVPWSRQAVIADPQGATFIASQFVPENRDITA